MSEFKRFIVFRYGWYYPSGGIDDAEISFDLENEAMEHYNSISIDGYCPSLSVHVFDCETRKIIARKSSES